MRVKKSKQRFTEMHRVRRCASIIPEHREGMENTKNNLCVLCVFSASSVYRFLSRSVG
jgi:hypothetical protein